MLIICEGEKTEPNYFRDLKNHFGLSSANIAIADKLKRNDPLGLVNHAEEIYKRDPDLDRVFCVFDRDDHSNFDQALAKIQGLKTRKRHWVPIEAIVSCPCFEFWILLHFQYTTQPFVDCNQVIGTLKKHLSDYSKSSTRVFDQTKDALDAAIERGKMVQSHHGFKDHRNNPSTTVHSLAEYLIHLKE